MLGVLCLGMAVKVLTRKEISRMVKYKWSSDGNRFAADANLIGRELEKIESNNGSLDTRVIVDFARKNQDSELYKCFEWDNDIAAEKYRLQQANRVLCSISVVISLSHSKHLYNSLS